MHISNIQETLNHSISQLPQTTHLTINDTTASTAIIEKLLFHCTQLRRLSIYNQCLETFPKLSNCSQLTKLEIRCANLKHIPTYSFPDSLKELNYVSEKLKEIPDFIFQGENLNKIRIDAPAVETLCLPKNNAIHTLMLNVSSLHCLTFEGEQPHLKILEVRSTQLTTLDVSFEHCSILGRLLIKAPIERIDFSFSAFSNLNNLELEKWNIENFSFLTAISENLHDLRINNPTCSWHNLPDVSQWPNIYRIRIQGCEDTQLHISSCSRLYQLYIYHCHFTQLPKSLANCTNLFDFQITNLPPINLKEVMIYLPQLNSFSTRSTKLEDISVVPPHTCNWSWVCLSDANSTFEHLDFLSKMPKVGYLSLGLSKLANPLALLREKTVHIDKLDNMLGNFKFKNHKQFCVLCSAIAKAKINQEDKEFFVNYFAKKTKLDIDKKWDWSFLLKATNISHAAFRKKLQTLIDEKTNAITVEKLWSKDAVVYITGKPKGKKTDIKKQVETLGMSYVAKYSDKVTHIIIGMSSLDFEVLKDKTFIPMTVSQLQLQYTNLTPQFLVEQSATSAGEQMIGNLGELLRSPDVEMVKVGLEIIKNGGTPPNIFEDLLVVQKTTSDTKIRKHMRELLEIHAPLEWKPIVRDRLSFKMVFSDKPEIAIRRQFKTLAKRSSSLMAGQLACLMYKNTGRGLRFALTAGVGKELKKQAYQMILKDHHLDFSGGLGMNRNDLPSDYFYYRDNGGNLALPVLALELGPIHSLDLSYCGYYQVKPEIIQFKDLKHLNFSNNDLNNLPDFFTELTNLETLNLSNNKFKIFPENLDKLPNLRMLDLQNERPDFTPTKPLTVPDAFLKSHPLCQVLL